MCQEISYGLHLLSNIYESRAPQTQQNNFSIVLWQVSLSEFQRPGWIKFCKKYQYWTLSRCNISHFLVKNQRKIKTSSATLVTVWVKFHPKCHPENLKVSPKCHQNGTKVAPKGDTFIFSKSKYNRININILFKLSLVGEVWWRFGDALKTCRWHFGWNFTQTVTKVALDVLIFLGFLTKKWLMLHLESVQYWYFLQNLIQPGRWNSDKETCHRTIEKLFCCVCGALDS